MLEGYVDAYRRVPDYLGRSTRRDFGLFLVGVACVVAALVGVAVWEGDDPFWIDVRRIVLLAQLPPLAALLVRRFRDANVPVFVAILVALPFAIPDHDGGPSVMIVGLAVLIAMSTIAAAAALPGRPAEDGSGPAPAAPSGDPERGRGGLTAHPM